MALCKFTFLGTAASMGVPVIGCECQTCLSSHPKDKRSRTSALLQIGGKNLLLDVGPDFHAQAIKHQIKHVDGLILTHTHFDHIAGIDDLRALSFKQKGPIPILGSLSTLEDLKKRMFYLFTKKSHRHDFFTLHSLDEEKGFTQFLGTEIKHFFYSQENMQVTGYRFGDFAFLTDIKEYRDDIHPPLKGVKTLVASAVDFVPTRAHISIPEARAIADKAGAKRLIITHIGHELGYEKTMENLPPNTELSYDGMTLTFEH